jgi:hypothetical protein
VSQVNVVAKIFVEQFRHEHTVPHGSRFSTSSASLDPELTIQAATCVST